MPPWKRPSIKISVSDQDLINILISSKQSESFSGKEAIDGITNLNFHCKGNNKFDKQGTDIR